MVRSARWSDPLAVVLGDGCIEIIRALTRSGIPCGVIAPKHDGAQHSRYVKPIFDWNWSAPLACHDERLVERLLRFGEAQDEAPTLFYCSEQSLIFVSRYRKRLRRAFRFVIADAQLVEDLSDKVRFATLAKRLSLPVPTTCIVARGEDLASGDLESSQFPLIVKPSRRDYAWDSREKAKALRVDTAEELRALACRLNGTDQTFVVQRIVTGPETAVESYHVYVDASGEISGEFVGRKIRTLPASYGHSTAVTISNETDVRRLGRQIVRALRYRGVAELEFKRSPSGELYLLEVNARFTLWHHLGACIGINIPAFVYTDLTGYSGPHEQARGAMTATWVHPIDIIAAKNAGVPMLHWLRWAFRSEAKALWVLNDPMPFIVATTAAVTGRVRNSWRRLQ